MLSPFPWPGGKRALVRTLLALIPAHQNYVEVFAGSAKILFAKDPSALEILNDVNGDVTNFFRVVKHRPSELAERLQLECIHAGRFRELVSNPHCQDEIDRALRFAYLVYFSFCGKGEHFGRPSPKEMKIHRTLDSVRALLARIAERLQKVFIEQRDYADILDRYDHPSTFFYLDPPYIEYQANGRYKPMSQERRAEMFERMARLRAKWLMSFEDHAEARAAARMYGFKVRRVSLLYTLSAKSNSKPVRELLLSNFAMAAART